MRETAVDRAPETRELVEGLRRFERLEQLRASRWFAEHRTELERLLATPLAGGPEGAAPAPPETLRVELP